MSTPNDKPSGKSKKEAGSNAYLKYAGIAFQFFAIILIAALVGKKIDEWLEMDPPLFTVFLILFFAVAYFVKLYYELIK